MLIDFQQVEGTLILIAVCDDTVLRDHAVETLRKRLPPEITLRDFRYDPEHLSLLEGAIETTASGNGRPAVSVTGFETLPRDKRTEAIKLLNIQRNRFGHTGIAVILWVNRATQFVKTILSARSEYENILHRDLLMAARCLADDVRVDAEVRRAISGKLLKLYFDFKLPGALGEDIRQVFARLRGTTVEKDVLEILIERFTDSDENVRGAAAEALRNLSAYVHSQERPEVMKLFLPLARSRAADSRETGYVGLRNLLVGDYNEAVQA